MNSMFPAESTIFFLFYSISLFLFIPSSCVISSSTYRTLKCDYLSHFAIPTFLFDLSRKFFLAYQSEKLFLFFFLFSSLRSTFYLFRPDEGIGPYNFTSIPLSLSRLQPSGPPLLSQTSIPSPSLHPLSTLSLNSHCPQASPSLLLLLTSPTQ